MGLKVYNVFECVGEIEEIKVVLEKCLEKGFIGKVINCYI